MNINARYLGWLFLIALFWGSSSASAQNGTDSFILDLREPQGIYKAAPFLQEELVAGVEGQDGNYLNKSTYSIAYYADTIRVDSVFNAGQYMIVATGIAAPYTGLTDSKTYLLNPKALKVTPVDQHIKAGTAPAPLTYTYQGFEGNDSESMIQVITPPTLYCAADEKSPPGEYPIRVNPVGEIKARNNNYMLFPVGAVGTVTVTSWLTEVLIQSATPNPVDLPKGGSVAVTVGAIVAGTHATDSMTAVNISLSGTAKKFAKLSKKTFNFSQSRSDSVLITFTMTDTMPVNGYTLTVALWSSQPAVITTASTEILLRSQTTPIKPYGEKIGFVSPKATIYASQTGVARVVTDSLAATETAILTLVPGKGITLYDPNQALLPPPYQLTATGKNTAFYFRFSPSDIPFGSPRSATIKIKSAIRSSNGKNIPITNGTLNISVRNDHPYYSEVPTGTVLYYTGYRPDSMFLNFRPLAKLADGTVNIDLLSLGLDSGRADGSTYISPLGSIVTLIDNRFRYDYRNLKATPAQLARGITDSFPFLTYETGGSTTLSTCYVSYGQPTSRGFEYTVTKNDFNDVSGGYAEDSSFQTKPSVFGQYYRPFANLGPGSKAKMTKTGFKVTYDKLNPDSVTAEYNRNIRIFNTREINKLRSYKGGARFFLEFSVNRSDVQRTGVGIDINVKSRENRKTVTAALGTVVLTAPVIDTIHLGVDTTSAKDSIYVLIVQGKYFGIAPKGLLEYKTTAKKASVKTKSLPVWRSPKNPEKRKPVLDLVTGQLLYAPTAAEMKAMSQNNFMIMLRLPNKLPKAADDRYDLLINSGSAYGGTKNIRSAWEQIYLKRAN